VISSRDGGQPVSHPNGRSRLPAVGGNGNGRRPAAAFAYRCRPETARYVRRWISELTSSLRVPQDQCDDIRVAVGEALSNAFRHGCRGGDHTVGVYCQVENSVLVVEITDPGTGFNPDEVPAPEAGLLREGGLGIHLMRLIMDEVSYTFDARGTTVRLVKRLQ